MKQLRDGFLIRAWRVSWTDRFTGVRLSDIYYARTKTAARARAERELRQDGTPGQDFRVGLYFGGAEIPDYHTQLA